MSLKAGYIVSYLLRLIEIMARKVSRLIPLTLLLLLMISSSVVPASAQGCDPVLVVGSVSSGGLPVEGLEIIGNMAMGENYIPIFNVTTDSEGRFEVFEDLFGNSFLLEFEYGGIVHLDAFVSVNGTYNVYAQAFDLVLNMGTDSASFTGAVSDTFAPNVTAVISNPVGLLYNATTTPNWVTYPNSAGLAVDITVQFDEIINLSVPFV